MSSDTVISVEGLSKRYLVGHEGPRESYQSLRDTVVRHGKNLARKTLDMARGRQVVQGDSVEEFWALKDVSFELRCGEVLGIIGRNGAGKSTLLKILSRITEPSSGRVTLKGRVASLLEVGTGFHPELTGRENIYLNGAILGMSRAEIRLKFDEIVSFAEVERFLDTPVKRYSSGMYVRLAFAVAAHLEPEILIVDEVLAVGDQQFQNKCLGKMREVAGGGRTVLFVSHNLPAIRALCSSAVLLEAGNVRAFASVPEVLSLYTRSSSGPSTSYQREIAVGTSPCLLSAHLATSTDGGQHETDEPLILDVEIHAASASAPVVNLHIYDEEQVIVMQTSCLLNRSSIPTGSVHRWKGTIPPRSLNVGRYRCCLTIAEYDVAIYEQLDFVLGFTVIDTSFPGPSDPSGWDGYCSPRLVEWNSLP